MEREFSEVGCYLNLTISLLEWKQPIRQVHLSRLPVCRGGPRQNAAAFVRTEWRQAQQNGEKILIIQSLFLHQIKLESSESCA